MDPIDICLIGSGAATTVTLIEVFNSLLSKGQATEKLTIAVIEKAEELWVGIPYGSRSSVNALTITNVNEFIYEHERPLFFEWLKATKDDWASYYRERGGNIAARWLENNLPQIENNAWEAVYIPRYIFGKYLQKKLTDLLKVVEEQQLVELKLIRAEAIDVNNTTNGFYEITLEHPDTTLSKITASKVVISIGSAPVKKMCAPPSDKAIYINDVYDPSVEENIKTIQSVLSKKEDTTDNNVLIIGSNASSIEWLYLIEGMAQVRKLLHKTIIISTSGILPYHISTETLPEHPVPNLDKLKADGGYSIETLVDAAMQDLKFALQHGANMDYVATIIDNTLELMQVLGKDAHKAFFAIHGVQLRNMFRRSGPEYKGGAQALIDSKEVVLLKGRFLNVTASENGVLLNYLDTDTNKQQAYPLSFKVIINCSGSDDLDQSSSRLIYNLVNSHICQMNLSRKGFEVNEKFEAAPNLYIMGPLLGGNMNKLIHFWQLENVARLTYLAPHLAGELLNA